ncbi:T9SS type A sorting domain-containing protein [Flavobacterium sp.]|uniref:T9SS type A sorting domain-containing protein n=1 Tax=Flavobacterium sp. TaxID=239 RepID=UPI00286AAABB|nr:T9SS type A sorting domain-containing protein [Flavobacterium sp.]
MEKKYSINKHISLSFLLLFTLNVSLQAQSKSGKGSEHTNFSKRVSARNVARNSNPTLSVLATDVVTACNSYTWPVNGLTYTNTGIYTDGGGITQLFNDQTAWDNSASTYGATVAFNNLSGIPTATTINIIIGTTSLTMSAPSGMYSSGSFIGVNNPGETITITFSPSIYGVAGNYFVTNISDNVVNGNVNATYSDGATDDRAVNTDTEAFGYFSTTPLTTVVLTTTSTNRYISLKNLSIATNPASNNTLDLTITPAVTPTFTAIDPICNGDTLAPLPTTSNNGITGTWSPALDSTTTTTHTFTPDIGQCATTKTKTITVNPIVTNSTNVTACNSYTWSLTGTTYTTSGAYSTYMTIPDSQVIDDLALWNEHAASFNATVISNTLSGINATNPTDITYGSVTVSMSAPGGMYSSGDFLGTGNANNPLTITFDPPVYGVSGNYFTSDFTDAIISGNITVNYSNGTVESRTVTTDTDTFGYFDSNYISSIVISSTTNIPDHYVSIKNLSIAANPSTCSTETLNLTINTLPPPGDTLATAIDVTATNYTTSGNNLAKNCFTDTVGTTSPDVWYKVILSPCTIALSANTCTNSDFDTILRIFKEDGTTEIGFSDDDCGATFQSYINDIDVSTENIVYVLVEGYVGLGREQGNYGLEIIQTQATTVIPIFNAVADICNGDILSALPTTSNNLIQGSWSPTLDNTTTTTYTFTPDAGQCSTTASLTIVVNPLTTNGSVTTSICDGDSYTWPENGLTYTTAQSGITVVTGCNTATLNLSITPLTTNGSVTTSICDGDSYTWPENGLTYTTAQSGVTVVTGCNTATLNLAINSASIPTGNASQSFDVADLNDATIANLVVNPTTVIWYGSLVDAQAGTNSLASSTVLTTGATYYCVNIVGSCSSAPFAVTVTVTLGNDEFDNLHFTYYPNPTSSVVTISYSRTITQITLINLLGQTLMNEKTNATEVQVDLSRLAEATYFIKVASDDKEKIIKVIKRN